MNKMHLKRHHYYNKNDKCLIIIIMILISTYLLIKLFTYKSETILNNYANKKSMNVISEIINKSINNTVIKSKTNDIIILDKKDNSIEISIDNEKINNIEYSLNNEMIKNVNEFEKGNYKNVLKDNNLIYYVPIGIISNIPILVNLGPKIPFKIDILSSININSDVSTKSYGINNTIVEVFLKINIDLQIILPFNSSTSNVEKKIILASKIIEGTTPIFYGKALENN